MNRQMDATAAPTRVRQFPCKACGANVVFTPGTTSLKCPYCGHFDAIPQTAQQIQEYPLDDALRHVKSKGTGFGASGRDVKCGRCGAVSHLAREIIASDCAFCGAPLAVPQGAQESDAISPEAILPFAVDKGRAEGLFRDWVNNRWFAPSVIRSAATLSRIQGVYRPFWTYDAHTSSAYHGERGEKYEEAAGDHVETRIRWTHEGGTFTRFFDDVLVPAGHDHDSWTEYPLQGLKSYQPDYLSGFVAERYTLPVDQGLTTAKVIMDRRLYDEACQRIGGDKQREVRVSTAYSHLTYKHVLLPLWIASYLYAGKVYRFQVNGQSGEVKGEQPYSYWKIAALVLAILIPLILVIIKHSLEAGR